MAVALETVVKQLTDSGIIAPAKLTQFVPPKAFPRDAEALLRELCKENLLTTFQAKQFSAGKGKALILGNYTILDKIGAGGMGQVFKASHRRMERVVAIKTLPHSLLKDVAAAARFQREVVAAAKLTHPNIVAAYDADEAGGIHFLVMEYVEGSDLSALVKKNGPIPCEKAVSYILQIARGLEFAHKQGVIHRDIKPANLLLDLGGTVKILDMGLARLSSDGHAATQAELTGSGAIMGTVDYMAPEQALNTKSADARADIYSLGCSLYFLLNGKSMYDGNTVVEKLLAHREQPIPPIHASQSGAPKQLEAIYRKMVAKQFTVRYQTMTEVAVALERCQTALTSPNSLSKGIASSETDSTLVFGNSNKHSTAATKSYDEPQKRISTQMGRTALLGLIATGLFGLAILYGIIMSIKTKGGTLVVTVDQPDAMVQVLDAEGQVEVSQKGGKGTITISIDPGKHRLKVQKDGFTVFGQDFEIEAGGKQPVTAKLKPLEEKPVVAVKPEGKLPTMIDDPAFKQWMKEVATQPAERQLELVAKRLQELNQGFDGKLTGGAGNDQPKIENDVVTELGVSTSQVTDISPVQALVGLKWLNCDGNWTTRDGKLSDLSPLQGLRLKTLSFNFTQVIDLSPLAGMPLNNVSCFSSRIERLEPLKGTSLASLAIGGTNVADLAPLRGMPLTLLNFGGTLVSDLSPLQGMPLVELGCAAGRVSDLSPLEGMELAVLRFKPERILKGMTEVRQMKTLTLIEVIYRGNHEQLSPNDFWKRYDAGEFKY